MINRADYMTKETIYMSNLVNIGKIQIETILVKLQTLKKYTLIQIFKKSRFSIQNILHSIDIFLFLLLAYSYLIIPY